MWFEDKPGREWQKTNYQRGKHCKLIQGQSVVKSDNYDYYWIIINYTHTNLHKSTHTHICLNDGECNLHIVGRVEMNEDKAELCQCCTIVPTVGLASAAFRMWHWGKRERVNPLTRSLTCAVGSHNVCTIEAKHQLWSGCRGVCVCVCVSAACWWWRTSCWWRCTLSRSGGGCVLMCMRARPDNARRGLVVCVCVWASHQRGGEPRSRAAAAVAAAVAEVGAALPMCMCMWVRVSRHACVRGGGERRGRRDRTPGRRGGSRGANPASLLRCRRSGNRGRYSLERLEPWIHGGGLCSVLEEGFCLSPDSGCAWQKGGLPDRATHRRKECSPSA